MENIRKHRDIKLVTTDKKRNKLVSEPNYHTINLISEDLSITKMEKKTKIKIKKPIYLGLSILEISKTLMYEFWYDYMKLKYGSNVKLCYMDTDSVIMNIKTNDFYEDIANENRFDTSNYEVNRPLPMRKNKKVIGLIKDELQSVTKIVRLAHPPPLFNVGCKFVYSFLILAAWHGFFRIGTTLSHGEGGILGNFNQA